MHILTIIPPRELARNTVVSGETGPLSAFVRLKASVLALGKPVFPEGQEDDALCVLLETPALLRALLSIKAIPSEVSFRVFSLQPPSGQLVGLSADKDPADPSSYDLARP
jgi:hypothetical protein